MFKPVVIKHQAHRCAFSTDQLINSNRLANVFSRHGAVAPDLAFLGVSDGPYSARRVVVSSRLWVISGLLLFDFPATIFAYSGFASRQADTADTNAWRLLHDNRLLKPDGWTILVGYRTAAALRCGVDDVAFALSRSHHGDARHHAESMLVPSYADFASAPLTQF
jgi:hypothetical protein